MNVEDFTSNSPGDLVSTVNGLIAFKPRPLPPMLEANWEVVKIVEEASRELSRLAGIGQMLPNPDFLMLPFIRREAVTSSRIEGTKASLSDLFLYEAEGEPAAKSSAMQNLPSDVREVWNYVQALEHGLDKLKELPVSLRLIRDMHKILMQNSRVVDKTPGEFRRIQVHIAAPGTPAAQATYVPPPPGPDMMECLGELEKYFHAPSDFPHLIRYALIHYQFEAIHPFVDGNGRVGRLLFPLLMISDGVLKLPLLYLSDWFERHRSTYYAHLKSISREGAWIPWVRFVLEGVRVQASDAVQRSTRLLELREELRERLMEPKESVMSLKLVDQLFRNPFISIQDAATVVGATRPTAASLINKLEERGILEEITGSKRNRRYVAKMILSMLDE